MSESTAKAVRRDLRRAMGDEGVAAVAEAQRNIANLAKSLANAHARIDELVAQHGRLHSDVMRWVMMSRRARLVTWVRGNYWFLIHRDDKVVGRLAFLRWLVKPL